MKTKTKTWYEISKNDLNLAGDLIKNKNRSHYAVHFCHQAVEKILKAIIQEYTNETPQRTHNFKILCQQAKLTLPQNLETIIAKLAPHYLASKYPEDIDKFYRIYTAQFGRRIFDETKELYIWLEKYLKSKAQ